MKSSPGRVVLLIAAILWCAGSLTAHAGVETPPNIQGGAPARTPPVQPRGADIDIKTHFPPAGSLTLSRPAAGANWYWGNHYSVAWTYAWGNGPHSDDTTISLWKGNSSIPEVQGSSATGVWVFELPRLPAGRYEVRVANSQDGRIAARQYVDIFQGAVAFTEPSYQASWPMRTDQEVRWKCYGHPGPLEMFVEWPNGTSSKVFTSNSCPDVDNRNPIVVPTPPTEAALPPKAAQYVMVARRKADQSEIGRSQKFTIPPRDCEAFGISLFSATWAQLIQITGKRLDQNCAAEFQFIGRAPSPLTMKVLSDSQVDVRVPKLTPAGKGYVRIYPLSGQNTGSLLPTVQPFTITTP